ncbi:hypothetical protein LXL04_013302 [Taraxacum kok-saghyz]
MERDAQVKEKPSENLESLEKQPHNTNLPPIGFVCFSVMAERKNRFKAIEPSICELFVYQMVWKNETLVLSFTDNEWMRDSSTMVENVVDKGFEDDYNEEVDEDSSSSDSDYIVDPEALVDDWDVDMREFHNAVDEIEWFGEHSHAESNISDEVDGLEVINSDVFESAGLEEDMRKRMLKNMNKKVACSSGEVHVKSFFVERGEGAYKVASYPQQEGPTYCKNDKIRVRVVCRGIISGTDGESDGGPSINSKVTCKGKKVNEKKKNLVLLPFKSRGVMRKNLGWRAHLTTHFSFSKSDSAFFSFLSTLFFDLSNPGMICTALGHMGSSAHPIKPQFDPFLAQDQNLLPGLLPVQAVTFTAMLSDASSCFTVAQGTRVDCS